MISLRTIKGSCFILAALTLLGLHVYTSAWSVRAARAQEDPAASEPAEEENPSPEKQLAANISTSVSTDTFTGKNIIFDTTGSFIPEGETVEEILWDFGDGIRTTGERVTHSYKKSDAYTVRLRITTSQGTAEDTREIRVFDHVIVLATDSTTSEEELEIKRQQAAKNDVFLLILRAKGGSPEAITEEDLTNQLIDARDALQKSELLITWTSGSVGSSVLSKFAQRIRQADEFSLGELNIESKGVLILSDTPFGVLAPTAQTAFDQLKPSYILLTKPQALDILLEAFTAAEARQIIFESIITHRVLGTFSSRSLGQLSPLNFISASVNFLVNHGVPINNITLVLMLPVIATILSVSRQVIGIKALGIITPAITTLSFLVMGLEYGLVVFLAVLAAGTLTRLAMRKLPLLYLPRMALVLTSVSFAILGLLAFGAVTENSALLSFSIFPILILTLLAEEFIAVQFKSGARRAFSITAWTLGLSIFCYYVLSWELLRTIIVSYPEVVLLAIPINILLGRWSGLRLTEYFRFRKLLRYVQ